MTWKAPSTPGTYTITCRASIGGESQVRSHKMYVSSYYFDKDVSEQTLPEAAMLAGSLNSPYIYDPYYCLYNASIRRNTILNLMVKHGYINQKECDDAKNVKVENMLCSSKITNSSVNAA